MTHAASRVGRPFWVNVTLMLLSAVLFMSMIALGNWQIRRLDEKLDLIARVEAHAYGAPVAAPTGQMAQTGQMGHENTALPPEYLRVQITGTFDHDRALRIKAVTDLGPGHWLMTPLATPPTAPNAVPNTYIWINRGFLPSGQSADTWTRPDGPQLIIGLVRHSRPGGTLMERNLPDQDRWVSPDIAVMSQAKGLDTAPVYSLPYYIDSNATGAPDSWPRGGLTRLNFPNSHLSYALTWYAMAVLFLLAFGYVVWDLRRNTR